MWNKNDIKGLMLLSGLVGVMVGTIGTTTFVLFNELKQTLIKTKDEA